MITIKRLPLLFSVILAIQSASVASSSGKWLIHEWGTFTSLQDENGKAIGGINTEDEPLPDFVHRLDSFLILNPTEVPQVFFQGAPRCHPGVTMRLETPVIYFHPPSTATSHLNVQVRFNGGWLSEFYPAAVLATPALVSNRFRFGPLTETTVSSLTWSNLAIGDRCAGPVTSSHVWNAPRHVDSAPVQTASGEAEQFLFYRGVAHLDAPLRITTKGSLLSFYSQLSPALSSTSLDLKFLWLVDIRADGKIAFRQLDPLQLASNSEKIVGQVASDFKSADYKSANLETLKASLLTALVSDGLFPDEAHALLNTWELSYFKSSGLRVFFLVPRPWTDSVLPLQISQSADLARAMVGRIELISQEQRLLLKQLAGLSTNQIGHDAVLLQKNLYALFTRPVPSSASGEQTIPRRVEDGLLPLAAAGIVVPQSYRLYLDLGRFRNALVLEELAAHPTPALRLFVQDYGLAGYDPTLLSGN